MSACCVLCPFVCFFQKNEGGQFTKYFNESGAAGAVLREKMKLIAWNCRGLGNSLAIRSLLNLQKEEDPNILFLSETKMDEKRIEGLRWKLGLTNLVVKDCKGKSGGLSIFWRKEINLQL